MKTTNNHRYPLLLFLLAILCFTACSDDSDPQPAEEEPTVEEPVIEEPDTEAPSSDLFYKLIRIENLPAGETGQIIGDPTVAPKNAMYFSLEDSTVRSSQFAKTNRWDLAFGNIAMSFLSGNNGTDPENHGSGANGRGGITILKENFDDVIDIPADETFRTGRDEIGTDDAGFAGGGTGWYLYDFSGEIVGDGSYEKRHVAYALQDTRTVVVRTARGNYAKIKMISVYKDAFTPDEWFRNTPHMYFTFEYVLVPAGSTEFEIKS